MLTLFTGNEVRDRDALIAELSKDVAQITLGQLQAPMTNMNAAELRGYVRARAAGVAGTCCRRLIEERRLPHGDEHKLVAAVLDRTVHLIIRDLSVRPIASIPSLHLPSRIAA